jgi:tRNA nucleotidyltransferase (CCA-adding enzyme)
MCEPSWQHFPHGADMGVRGIGKSKAAAFEQAALAVTALVTDPQSVRAEILVRIECQAPDDELLLVEWLNDIIFEMATRKMLFARFAVDLDGNRLSGTAWGEAIDLTRHDAVVEPKGATCTSLEVCQDESGCWRAQCIIDV